MSGTASSAPPAAAPGGAEALSGSDCDPGGYASCRSGGMGDAQVSKALRSNPRKRRSRLALHVSGEARRPRSRSRGRPLGDAKTDPRQEPAPVARVSCRAWDVASRRDALAPRVRVRRRRDTQMHVARLRPRCAPAAPVVLAELAVSSAQPWLRREARPRPVRPLRREPEGPARYASRKGRPRATSAGRTSGRGPRVRMPVGHRGAGRGDPLRVGGTLPMQAVRDRAGLPGDRLLRAAVPADNGEN